MVTLDLGLQWVQVLQPQLPIPLLLWYIRYPVAAITRSITTAATIQSFPLMR